MSIYAGPNWEVGGSKGPGVVRTRDNWTAWRAGRAGSNAYPTDRTGVAGSIGLSIIPGHCVPGRDDEDAWGDRLRLTVCRWDPEWHRAMAADDPARDLILDVPAARALAAALTEWADGPIIHPKEPR